METKMYRKEDTSKHRSSELKWILGGALVSVWFGVIVALAANGSLALLPGDAPGITLAAILGPPFTFALALLLQPRFKAWALSLDPALLTALQGWRVLGGGFLMLYTFGHLPGIFAFPAGVGDVAVGLGAPFAAIALARGSMSLDSRRLLSVHLSGLLDFVVAIGTGIIARQHIPGLVEGVTSSAMGELPLVLIPAFAVPIFIILHLIVLVQIREAGRVRTLSVAATA
jgi:hypothetical protein